MDDLLDDITGLVGICLLPELDDSTDNVSKESSKDEDSDKTIIVFWSLSFLSHQKPVNADFFRGEIDEPGNEMLFLYHPILKNHSNQEHDDAIHHPSSPDIIE